METLLNCYVPPIKITDLICQGPYNPLSQAFELKTVVNWKGSGFTLSEAQVAIHQWLDPKTGDYTFVMPDDNGHVEIPGDSSFEYAGDVIMRIRSIDKDDENGKVIVSGESARWQAMKELGRICKEHKLTQEDLKRARENPKKNEYNEDWKEFDLFFEIL